MATLPGRHITAADLDGLPHEWDTLYELIGGVLYLSTKPSLQHPIVLANLLAALYRPVKRMKGAVVQEPGVVWEERGEDNVAPDLAIVFGARPASGKLRRCPDICVEVLSPGEENRQRDLVAKRALYWRRGAKEYWVLDLQTRTVLRLTRGKVDWREEELSSRDRLSTPLLKRWSGVKVGTLFET